MGKPQNSKATTAPTTPPEALSGVEGAPISSLEYGKCRNNTRKDQVNSPVATLLRIAEPVALAATPLVLLACAFFQMPQSALIAFAAVCATLLVVFARFETSRPALRQIMPTVVLAALAAAGRILFAPIPDFKPVSAICIMAGVVFGKRCGFMVGALAALVSNMFFGQGAWTPWQMYAWGTIGYLAGIAGQAGAFDPKSRTQRQKDNNQQETEMGRSLTDSASQTPACGNRGLGTMLLLAFGFASGLFYGFLLNSWYIVGFINPITWPAAIAAYLAGLPLDLVHATATVVFLSALYLPWRTKLERIRTKYDLAEKQ